VFVNANPISAAVVPVAPSNLTGSVVRTGNRAEVTLNWGDNATTETGFTIERATNAAFTVGLTTTNVAANTTTATQSRLYRGVTYYFRVRANNLGGSSAWSNVFSAVTP
jgi:predicted phage tail protein